MEWCKVAEGVRQGASLDKNWMATLTCLNILVNIQSYACL